MKQPRRAAIYARYSSFSQNPRSIEDQIAMCRRRIEENGDAVAATFSDRALSGASTRWRDGLAQLMAAAERGEFDVVWAEALDRLSRDQADTIQIYKRLTFHEVELFTHEEGEITSMHVGLKGIINEAFLTALAHKTRRGKQGAVHRGRVQGPPGYGYEIPPRRPDEPRGQRTIVPEEAEIVRRIFRMYADGMSACRIAFTLNEEGVPGPRGRLWREISINGQRNRGSGVLNNAMYRGLVVYGRKRTVTDPVTNQLQPRYNPESDWIVKEMPSLRIVDEELWQRVQLRRRAGADRSTGKGNRIPNPLTARLVCSRCGGAMRIMARGHYYCKSRYQRMSCDAVGHATVREVEDRAIREAIRWAERWDEGSALIAAAIGELEKRRRNAAGEIEAGESKIAHLLDSIEQGGCRPGAVNRRIDELERLVAVRKMELGSMSRPEVRSPDALLQNLKANLDRLAEAAAKDETRKEALLRFRELVDRIEVEVHRRSKAFGLRLHPRVDAMVAFAIE